jgi:hypothetical protein
MPPRQLYPLTGFPDSVIINTYTGLRNVTILRTVPSPTEIMRSKASLISTMEGVVGNNVKDTFQTGTGALHRCPF